MYKEPAEGFGSITNEDGTPWYPASATPGTPDFEELKNNYNPIAKPLKGLWKTPVKRQSLSERRGNAKMKARKDNRGQVFDAMKSFADKLVKIILK